jgi:hypothetical protein
MATTKALETQLFFFDDLSFLGPVQFLELVAISGGMRMTATSAQLRRGFSAVRCGKHFRFQHHLPLFLLLAVSGHCRCRKVAAVTNVDIG